MKTTAAGRAALDTMLTDAALAPNGAGRFLQPSAAELARVAA